MIKNWFIILGVLFIACWVVMLGIVLMAQIKYKINQKRLSKNTDQDTGKNNQNLVVAEDVNNKQDNSMVVDKVKVNNNEKYSLNEGVLEKYDELQANIKKYIDNSNNFPLLVVGSMIGLEAKEIIGGESNFESKFIESSKELIIYERFKIITNSRITSGVYEFSDVDSIDIYHQILCLVYIEKFNNFLTSFKEYFDFIEQNKEMLISKKRVYLKEDEFGDVDGADWIDYLQRFAERRNLYKESEYPDDLEAVSNYVKIIKLDNFEGKVISYLLALWEHFEKKDDKYASIYTGVDFEQYLKTLVEEQLEGAYVETTPASGDHGADLLVRFRGIVVAVQAKYYTGSVGNAAVQEIHSGMSFYDADYGMVVTQSKYTEHAKSLAMKLDIHLEDVETFIPKIKSLSN